MPRGAENGLGKFPFRAARRFAWGGGIAKIDAALPHGQGGAEGLRSDAACLRQERCVAARSILRRYGVSASAPGNGEGFARFSFPHRFSFLPRGERRALPAPAQGPSALENPLRCRAYLAAPRPRPLRASPPSAGHGGRRPHPLKDHWPLRIPSAAALISQRSTRAPSGLLSLPAGHGGRCPHPLKGHRPLRIPFAAAFRPKFRALSPTHKDGRLLSLSLPSSPCPSSPSLNATKRPRPLSVGRGRVAHSR